MSTSTENDAAWLLDNAKQELKAYSIDRVASAFVPVLSEFEAYVEGIVVRDEYRSRLSEFIAFLKSAFGLPTTVMLVQTNKYTTDMWGPLYWSFLHYASILLQYALRTGRTDDVKGFPILVYNIDKMLPCSVCVAHYLSVKRSPDLVHLIKTMSFGHVMQGVYQFHNFVSKNVHAHRYPTNAPPVRMFTAIDFANLYHCYPLTTTADSAHKYVEYSRPRPDWQSPLHLSVTVILAVNYNVSYTRASNYLKRAYGQHEPYPGPTVYTDEDQRFEYATSIHDVYDVLLYTIANRRSKTKSNEDEESLAYVRQAVDTIRTAFDASGKKLNFTAV